jgi:hypothetical protein
MKLSARLTLAALSCALAPLTLAAQDHNAAAMPMKPPVPPSESVTITFDGHETRLPLTSLSALPQVTVHVFNAHRQKKEDYTGPLLSDVLAKAGLVASSKTEPLILHSGVIATGTDKYFVLYSLAEVEPMFTKSQVIVALTKNGGQPNTEAGNIELINTDGAKPARWLHGLTSLSVVTLSNQP